MTAPIFLFASWAVMSSGVAVKVSITVFLAAAETCPSNAHKILKKVLSMGATNIGGSL